jgi:hypothetical protein
MSDNGMIYYISGEDGLDGDIYIGSTEEPTLEDRLKNHINDYKCWKNGRSSYVSSYDVFEKYGVENCKITLLEIVGLNDIKFRREGHYQKTMNCVNKIIAGRTDAEWREDNKLIITEKKKQYHNDNRVADNERSNQYRIDNAVLIKQKKKIKTTCICGLVITLANIRQHEQSNQHQTFITNQIVRSVCVCGSSSKNIKRHEKSIKHQTYITNNPVV